MSSPKTPAPKNAGPQTDEAWRGADAAVFDRCFLGALHNGSLEGALCAIHGLLARFAMIEPEKRFEKILLAASIFEPMRCKMYLSMRFCSLLYYAEASVHAEEVQRYLDGAPRPLKLDTFKCSKCVRVTPRLCDGCGLEAYCSPECHEKDAEHTSWCPGTKRATLRDHFCAVGLKLSADNDCPVFEYLAVANVLKGGGAAADAVVDRMLSNPKRKYEIAYYMQQHHGYEKPAVA